MAQVHWQREMSATINEANNKCSNVTISIKSSCIPPVKRTLQSCQTGVLKNPLCWRRWFLQATKGVLTTSEILRGVTLGGDTPTVPWLSGWKNIGPSSRLSYTPLQTTTNRLPLSCARYSTAHSVVLGGERLKMRYRHAPTSQNWLSLPIRTSFHSWCEIFHA